MQQLIQIILLVCFCLMAVFIIYLLIIAIAGKFAPKFILTEKEIKLSIAILIPAYKENAIILDTVKSAVKHNYPSEKFQVYVAADQIAEDILSELKNTGAEIMPVSFRNSTKAASLNAVLNNIPEGKHDIALVLDADNILQEGSLDKINSAFQKGYKGVQLHRIAKNFNNEFAIADGIIEEINNHLFRRGQQAIGFSSHTIGSGMAFEFSKLKEIYNKPGIIDNPACDREVDFEIMKAGIKIAFLDEVYVYDEKVSATNIFFRQRLRWLESHIFHLKLFLKEKVTLKGKEYWNRLFSVLIPPRVIFFLFFFISIILYIIEKIFSLKLLIPEFLWWVVLMALFLLTLIISLPGKKQKIITWKLFPALLVLIITYLKAFLGIRHRRKEFIHTPKNYSNSTKDK